MRALFIVLFSLSLIGCASKSSNKFAHVEAEKEQAEEIMFDYAFSSPQTGRR